MGAILLLGLPTSTAAGRCQPEPITIYTPTGIAGCQVWGTGTASHYGPGTGVARNACTWAVRHHKGCGRVLIRSLETGRATIARVVDFCDCYTGTPDERIIDLQYGVLDALGLDPARGLYRVTVRPYQPWLLPDTAIRMRSEQAG